MIFYTYINIFTRKASKMTKKLQFCDENGEVFECKVNLLFIDTDSNLFFTSDLELPFYKIDGVYQTPNNEVKILEN